MDTGKGRFIEIPKDSGLARMVELAHPKHGGIFTVGETVVLKGSRFRIKHITQTGMKLKLLPKE